MIKNKKLMVALSFTLGTALLVSTAFADIMSTSGYEHLKSAIKYTSKSCNKDLKSFTTQFTVTLRDNDLVLCETTQTIKIDNSMVASESSSSTVYSNGIKETFNSYSDKNCTISYNALNDTYHVFEYSEPRQDPQFEDIFEEDEMDDIEKIIDAALGNLKDYVISEQKPDGKVEFSGSLDDTQIPVLINAVSSFAFKRIIPDMGIGIDEIVPQIKDDVFIKNISGNAFVNEDGLLESIFGSGTLSGKDAKGATHDLKLDILARLYDVNSTIVIKPDLTGKTVEKTIEIPISDKIISKKFIGKYKNDIVIEKEDSFIKIGERNLEITKIEDDHVTGRYSETYTGEYEEYSKYPLEFDFNAEIQSSYDTTFEAIDSQGQKLHGSIYFYDQNGKISFYVDAPTQYKMGAMYVDTDFSRVFED